MSKYALIFVIVVFIVMNVIMQPFIYLSPSEDSTNNVPCYDNYNNEIEGLNCVEEVAGMGIGFKVLISLVSLFMSFVVSIIFWRIIVYGNP